MTKSFNWSVVGHTKILDFLQTNILNQTFAQSYLFVGPKKVGKTSVAKKFSQFLICDNYSEYLKNGKVKKPFACGECSACQMFKKGIYADYYLVERERNDKGLLKKNISIKQIRDLQSSLSKRSFQNSYKIVIIPEAEAMSLEASNSLLKFLEEPTAKTIIILISQNTNIILPTIVSRCQILNFSPVPRENIFDYLVDQGANRSLALELSAISQGRITVALKYFNHLDLYLEHKQKIQEVFKLFTSSNSEKFQMIDTLLGKSGVDSAKKVLDIFISILRDVELLKYYNDKYISNIFLREEMQALKDLDFNFNQKLQSAEKSKLYLEQNINPKLVFENLFI
ncbi:hypothetical protein A2533_01020 [Candidatus Falkowbacteria bacterium RIFOXYD2_FULL_35_9]|uniref:DNA polymerase III subunit delta n=1 Tax=Candidatus Falkowbacteria bacterium RIFOXYC2_FULL_36_12 TaxID=1798002 RepID=A0A1F5SYI2_9BACT|nr:MAG: hypothetical protein A2478_04665 [Candidatus Falkowbacteria bacterium RIFOXYC2_FULL_36_12]OGF34083.1 MAG: hypothetical protein A2223_04425 [Candidatus Falkowbacteria bacterium RIFOXYA2_FULL_35_8]OGF48442.1 MAG: hypothetical protein A2533_01020 [Candidatus Falkowbacteria bacterium RIFOXYD2_FULL_35_9]